jgi:hypothetical protein
MTSEQQAAIRAILTFDAMPIEDIHQDHRGDALRLTTRTLDKILACPRLRPRLTRMVNRRLGLPPCLPRHFETAANRIALRPTKALQTFALKAGAIWHGKSLAGLILSTPRRKVIAEIGDELLSFAIDHRHLAAQSEVQMSADMLIASIREDGSFCLEQWCTSLPPALRARVRLKLPKTGQPMRRSGAGVRRAATIIEAIVHHEFGEGDTIVA